MATLTSEEMILEIKRLKKRLREVLQTEGMILVTDLVASAVETNALLQSLKNEVEQSMGDNLPKVLVRYLRRKYAVDAENETVFWTAMVVYDFLLRSSGPHSFKSKELSEILTLFPKLPNNVQDISELFELTPSNAQIIEQIISSEQPKVDDEQADIQMAKYVTQLKRLLRLTDFSLDYLQFP